MSIYAPFRFLVAVAMALLIATLIASSSVHGMTLGDAVAQSALGSPLRVVIPISTAPDESLQPACFRLLPAAGDGSAQIVTARVSLERAASAPRLVVTTPNAISDPAIRFSIQAGCDASTRRLYVLLLDPPAGRASAAVGAKQATAREPRQERSAPQPPAARRSVDRGASSETLVVRVPLPADHGVRPAATAPDSVVRGRAPTADGAASAAFRLVAGTAAASVVSALPAADSENPLWTYLAAALAVVGVIALAVLFARRHRAQPEIPQWTRPGYSGPRTFADLTSTSATLSPTLTHASATTAAGPPSSVKSVTAPPSIVQVSAPASRSRSGVIDPSTMDTLLDELDPDIIEDRVIREAWAAARSDVEREMDGNEILQAIEAAERDLLLAPPAPAQSAIERALDEDLLRAAPRRR